MRWLAAGTLVGALAALIAFAPASWVADAVGDATAGRLLLADPSGTVWTGSATPVLTSGSGGRDASALPGRLHWRLGTSGLGLLLRAEHACCLNGTLQLRLAPGLDGATIEVLPREGGGALGQWPAAWLMGLGTPWNTLQPSGSLQLRSPGLVLQSAGGRWRFSGQADLELNAFASRLSTLDVLGSYRLTVAGDAARGQAATLKLATTSGPLLINGSGELLGAGASSALRFRGVAEAASGQEGVLNNLLNIIGRRQGAQAVISIG